MTERGRGHSHDGLYAWVCDHRAVIVVNRNLRAGKHIAAAFSADGRKRDSRNVPQQVLDIAAAMAANSDETNSNILW